MDCTHTESHLESILASESGKLEEEGGVLLDDEPGKDLCAPREARDLGTPQVAALQAGEVRSAFMLYLLQAVCFDDEGD